MLDLIIGGEHHELLIAPKVLPNMAHPGIHRLLLRLLLFLHGVGLVVERKDDQIDDHAQRDDRADGVLKRPVQDRKQEIVHKKERADDKIGKKLREGNASCWICFTLPETTRDPARQTYWHTERSDISAAAGRPPGAPRWHRGNHPHRSRPGRRERDISHEPP